MNFSTRLRLALASFALIAFGSLAIGQQTNPGVTVGAPAVIGDCVKYGPKAVQITTAGQPCLAGTASALTRTDDTNVTLTLSGTPATALLQAVNLQLGWAGTLAAGRLNSNVVQSIVNDTNVTGSIAAQALTLGWTGTLAVARGGTACGAASGTCVDNISGFASTGIMSRTGAGTYTFSTISALLDAIGSTRGSVLYRGAAGWAALTPGAANTVLTSNGAGADPSYAAAGSGTVTSATIAAGAGMGTFTGTCTITTTGTCTIVGSAAQLPGIAGNTAASAGNLGEIFTSTVASGSAVSFATTNTPINVTSISPTAGQWQICGGVYFDVSVTATVTRIAGGIGTASAAMPVPVGAYFNLFDNAASANPGSPTGCIVVNLSGTTQYFLVANGSYTAGGGQLKAYGTITATRMR